MSILEDKNLKDSSGDMMLSLDRISSALIVLSGILSVLSLGYLIMFVYECIQHKRKAADWSNGNLARLGVTLVFWVGLAIVCICCPTYSLIVCHGALYMFGRRIVLYQPWLRCLEHWHSFCYIFS